MSSENRRPLHVDAQPKIRCVRNNDRVEDDEFGQMKPSTMRRFAKPAARLPGRLPPHHRCGQAGRWVGNTQPPGGCARAKIRCVATTITSRRRSSFFRKLIYDAMSARLAAGPAGWVGNFASRRLCSTKNSLRCNNEGVEEAKDARHGKNCLLTFIHYLEHLRSILVYHFLNLLIS